MERQKCTNKNDDFKTYFTKEISYDEAMEEIALAECELIGLISNSTDMPHAHLYAVVSMLLEIMRDAKGRDEL
mgnify:FL=1